MKVAVFSAKTYDQDYLNQANRDRHQLVFQEATLKPETVLLAKGCEAVCCFVNDHLDAPVLEQLAELGVRLVALRCAGFNQVDLARAQALGLTLARVPQYSPHAVAEHTLGLILTLNRQLHRAYHRVRDNDYSLNGLLGFDLVDKTVAVVAGLKSQKIGYLGLDVYEEEGDLFFEDYSNQLLQDDVFARLLTFPNVVITGHQAFFTREALSAIAETTIANISHFEAGELDQVCVVEAPKVNHA